MSVTARATVFGLKSCGSGSADCGNVIVAGSLPPTRLFSFQEDSTGFVDIGAVQVGGNDIDADGLALSLAHGLLAFELQKAVSSSITTGSRLISLDPATAVGTAVGSGSFLTDRDIRGAVFDQAGALVVVDAANDELLQIDPTSGAVLGVPVDLTLGGNPFDLSSDIDIAVRRNGALMLVDLDDFYTLDGLTGALTLVHTDGGQQVAGVTFSQGAPQDALFAYEVGGTDDIFRYDVDSSFARMTLHADIIPSVNGGAFNAGRGDLASLTPTQTAPEPTTLALLALGLAGLGVARRHTTLVVRKWSARSISRRSTDT